MAKAHRRPASKPATSPRAEPDVFRKAILDRLRDLDRKRLWLATECDGRPGKSHLYQYLAGNKEISVDSLVKIFEVLGLGVRAERGPRAAPKVLPPEMPL